MTLKEIIEEIENHTYSSSPVYGIDDDMANNIIVALKAGQGMRDSLGIASYLTLAEGKTYRQAEVGDNKLAVESIDAWDAATKEEDV